ncbi:deoxycytidylate deaminase [Bradyrhizobium sp. HKCCYLS1011]|uniref:deoxycytidylate deaminase n=1 Tax=Bradyrhizobium sp. HKCCYLS1011 TaxID=3420733 RepID=UPI003EBA97DB
MAWWDHEDLKDKSGQRLMFDGKPYDGSYGRPLTKADVAIPHRSQLWWDLYHLGVAREIAVGSKDPSTQVGAVIVRPDRTVASTGYNGFPRGIADTAERLNDRDVKIDIILHGEINAILTAREPLHGYTLYTWPFLTCHKCALVVIQAGIKRVVAPTMPADKRERWKVSMDKAEAFFAEAGIRCDLVDMPEDSDVA